MRVVLGNAGRNLFAYDAVFPNGIIVLAENLNIIACNQKAAGILSTTTEGLVGRNIKQLPLLQELAGFFAEEKDISYEINMGDKVITININALKNESGHFLYYLIIIHDLTEFRCLHEMAREQERLAVVGRIAAGVVHELRNPMTTIKGFAQLLKEKRGREIEPYIDYIIEEIDNCVRIISDFLKMAKPNPPCLESGSLNEIVDEIVTMVEPRAFLQRTKVETELASHLPACLFDAAQLKQVFLNLVDNALEAMKEGGTLRFKTFLENSSWVGFALQDTGRGIPENLFKKIGLPFFSTRKSGTGLGLFICHSIVQDHGGQIEVESKEGEGTTFWIYLPVEKPSL